MSRQARLVIPGLTDSVTRKSQVLQGHGQRAIAAVLVERAKRALQIFRRMRKWRLTADLAWKSREVQLLWRPQALDNVFQYSSKRFFVDGLEQEEAAGGEGTEMNSGGTSILPHLNITTALLPSKCFLLSPQQ